jgi:hypothetical protein
MIPPAPIALAAFGVWYGGLCRALVAPWLDPWWLVRAAQHQRLRAAARQARGVRLPAATGPAAAANAGAPARAATIIPFDRARARVLAGRKPADHRR